MVQARTTTAWTDSIAPSARRSLAGLAKREVDSRSRGEGVLAVGERRHAVEREPGRATPHDDITVLESDAARPILTVRSAEQEHGGKPERDRDDRRAEIALVAVLVQG